MAVTLVPLSIWRDPEFTSLSREAQWLWFALKTSHLGHRQYSEETALGLCASMSKRRLRRAERELRASSYALAFIPRKYRPVIPAPVRTAVYDRDGWRCRQCGASDPLSLDHIFPYSRGGTDAMENLQTLCRPCNSSKGAKIP